MYDDDDEDSHLVEFGIATLTGGNACHDDASDFAALVDEWVGVRDMLFGQLVVGEA